MKKLILFALSIGSLSTLFTSCSNSKEKSEDAVQTKNERVYGGVLHLNENENYQTLYPIAITDVTSSHIANQIYEGLVKFNAKDLTILPCLSEKWDVDASGTTYTFHIKKGVFFQNDECFSGGTGREMKASDVAYSFKLLCTDSKENANFSGTFGGTVLGADKFFAESKTNPDAEIEGIKVIDDYTIEVRLIAPSKSFLYTLAMPATSIVAKEVIEKYGADAKVGTGPFIFAKNSTSEKVVVTRNNNYHGVDSSGNKLPFLDSIVFSFMPSKKIELDSFINGSISMITGLPSESIKEVVEGNIKDFQNKPAKYILERTPEMISQYYEFNLNKPPFDNIKVRKAISYAINRNVIVDEVLKGEAYGPGIHGVCPPSFKGYNTNEIIGYKYDPEEAKRLLADAGYPDGKGFPKVKLETNSGGMKNTAVVLEIQKQLLSVLNINVDFEVVSMAQKFADQRYARFDIVRGGWMADFPSPENFLWTFYGGNVPESIDKPSYPNHTRYRNPEFDELFDAGKAAKTQEESYAKFMKAEQLLMKDAPVIVLWYDESYHIMKSSVRNFFSNPMRYKNYSEVYIKELEGAPTAETIKGAKEGE